MASIDYLDCSVKSPAKTYGFRVSVHRSEYPTEHQMPPEFYTNNGAEVPTGVHHELKLLESPVWGRVDSDVPIHIYKHPKTSEYFVCYIAPVKTLEHAKEFFIWWCVGTVYSIEHKRDFAELIAEHSDDFLEYLQAEHGIAAA